MRWWLATRLLATIPVLLVVSLVVFLLLEAAPGDPARLLLEASGIDPVPPEALAAKRAELGLDDSLPQRYWIWLTNALQGDLGRSYRSYEPVTQIYASRFPATAALVLTAAAIGIAVAVPLGLLSANRRGGALDSAIQAFAVAGVGLPGFWIAFILMYIFGARLHLLPVFGSLSPRGIVLPALVLALPFIAILTRLLRASTADVLGQEFVQTARAKGLSGRSVQVRHVLPNALLPAIPVIGLELAGIFSGAAVIEYVFAWPGLGKRVVDAALLRDTPVIAGFAVIAAAGLVLVNILIDLVVHLLDPRISDGH
ncbi:MAG: ABC transporter permease [Thermomicrobiales bacterium]|nr:ABC transporter permease [Thermomicrobiales bacterium]